MIWFCFSPVVHFLRIRVFGEFSHTFERLCFGWFSFSINKKRKRKRKEQKQKQRQKEKKEKRQNTFPWILLSTLQVWI